MIASDVKARDLMQAKVLTIPVSTPVNAAIRFLEEERISGAPVVDESGKVVGVLSLKDLAEAKEAEVEDPREGRPEYYIAEPLDEGIDLDADEFYEMTGFNPDVEPEGTVADWMTEEVISVKPGAKMREVCRLMIQHRIHRVLVLERGQLKGILSTYDVVRYIAEGG